MMREPTPEQCAVLQAAADGHDLVLVNAGAGAGKTSTMEMLTSVPYRRAGKQLYSQFAVAGGEDAARRLAGSGAVVLRPGQLAWRHLDPVLRDRLDEPRVNSKTMAERVPGLTDAWVRDNTMHQNAAHWAGNMRQTVTRFCHDDEPVVKENHLPPGVAGSDKTPMVAAAQWLWDTQLCGAEGIVNFTMDHAKKHWSLACPRYGYGRIMLDEAQDTNPCDLHVFKSQDTQLVVVGDQYQQIYQWRGAVNALSPERLPGGFWLNLTWSFRFGPGIAEQANKLLRMLHADFELRGARQHDSHLGDLGGMENAVLCRTNAECMNVAIGFLQQGKTVALAGKTRSELMTLAIAALKLQRRAFPDHPAMNSFRTWQDFCDYAGKDPDGQEFQTLIRLIKAHGQRLVDMLKLMDDDESGADVVVSTVWKAKGLEWPAVRLADDFWPGEEDSFNEDLAAWWMSDAKRDEFLRVAYVAVTRAKLALDSRKLAWVEHWRGKSQGD